MASFSKASGFPWMMQSGKNEYGGLGSCRVTTSCSSSIRYFRGEFVRGPVDPEKFDKEYTYGIRYNYGKEGKKVNWAPWNCMRIIMESVGPGENHGCPFKHHDQDVLKAALVKSGEQRAFLPLTFE